MSPALLYLWLALLKRRTLQFLRGLRRPTTLVGFVAVLGLFVMLWHSRHEEVIGRLIAPAALKTYAVLMLGGSLVKGFWQRGLAFEPPDIEFVFTSPFTQRQVVFYRLLPNYLYALVQGIVLAALLAPHPSHPVLMGIGLALFQIICFHVSTAASLFAGTLPEDLHHRLRCMMLAAGFLFTALYLRVALEVHLVPDFALSPVAQLLFYPAVNLPDAAAAASPALYEWVSRLSPNGFHWAKALWVPALYVGALSLGAGITLWGLLRLKANLFEPSLATTSALAERRLRRRQGRDDQADSQTEARSASLPTLPFFRGVGAIMWKNLLAARRSRRQLVMAFFLTSLYVGGLTALLWAVHHARPERPPDDAIAADFQMRGLMFHAGLAFWTLTLAFFLQRIFPFDFRRDGNHLMDLRTLPATPLCLVLAEVAVPVGFVLLCQGICLAPLLLLARFDWPILLLLLLAYPAVALALSLIWNLHYLLSASRRAAGQAQSPSAVGTLIVVVMSFLVFLPALWTSRYLARCVCERWGIVLYPAGGEGLADANAWLRFVHVGVPITGAGTIGVQYLVNLLLLLALAFLFRNAAVARDSQ